MLKDRPWTPTEVGSGTGHVHIHDISYKSNGQHAGNSPVFPLFISNFEEPLEGALSLLGSGSSTSGWFLAIPKNQFQHCSPRPAGGLK